MAGVALASIGRHQPVKVAPARVSGRFFGDCNPQVPSAPMRDDAMAERLRHVSSTITARWLA